MADAGLIQIKQRMGEFIHRQYAANDSHNLGELAGFDGVGYTVHPDLLAFVLGEREGVCQVIAGELSPRGQPGPDTLLAQFVASTEAFIYRSNQFIRLTSTDRLGLTRLYRAYIRDFGQFLALERDPDEALEAFQSVVERHFLALGAFVQSLGRRLGEELVTTSVVSAEYPPDLQLAMLGLDPAESLLEPILDVGCGQSAALVGWLRRTGREAYGLDTAVAPSSTTFQTDWLDFDFGVRQWGTVLSHMAFSNHFLFHHLSVHGAPESYAQKTMQILRSLVAGGQFCYAPGLPFIEGLLPRQSFVVRRRRVVSPGAAWSGLETTYTRLLGQSPLYATRIIRV